MDEAGPSSAKADFLSLNRTQAVPMCVQDALDLRSSSWFRCLTAHSHSAAHAVAHANCTSTFSCCRVWQVLCKRFLPPGVCSYSSVKDRYMHAHADSLMDDGETCQDTRVMVHSEAGAQLLTRMNSVET